MQGFKKVKKTKSSPARFGLADHDSHKWGGGGSLQLSLHVTWIKAAAFQNVRRSVRIRVFCLVVLARIHDELLPH